MRIEGRRASAPIVPTLEVDVMRFMAIVGFCLLAVLAVASFEVSAPPSAVAPAPFQPPPAPIASPAPPPVTATSEDTAPIQPQRTQIEPPAPAPAAGWQLQFADTETLQVLIREGRVRLFATTEGAVLELTTAGPRIAGDLPQNLRPLLPETVPRAYQRVLGKATVTRWQVWLDDEIESAVQTAMDSGVGGQLAIERPGTVGRLEK